MATFNPADVLATVASYEQTGSISATARELGTQRVTVRNRLNREFSRQQKARTSRAPFAP